MNRRQNQIDVLLANAQTGAVKTILVERDSAWVDVVNDVRWLDRDTRFTWMSERNGWRRMYGVSRDGATVRALSADSMDVTHPAFAFGAQAVLGTDATGEYVYHYASPQNPTQLYLYRTSLKRLGVTTRVTPADQAGNHSYSISPNGRYAVHSWSSFGSPPTIEIITLPDHRRVRVLQDNAQLRTKLATLEQGPREFFRVDIGGGVMLDGWMLKPPGFDQSKKYPVLFHVYGEPASQTVVDSWGGATYLWHLMLSQMGYIVVSLDNRGTPAPRGREWRKAIYNLFSQEELAESNRRIVVGIAMLEEALSRRTWLASDQYSLADVNGFNLAYALPLTQPDLANDEKTPHIMEWLRKIYERPATRHIWSMGRTPMVARVKILEREPQA